MLRGLLVTLLVFAVIPSMATAEESVKVKTDGAAIYTKPGGPRIADMAKGSKLKVEDVRGEWVKVSVEGWMEMVTTDYSSSGAKQAAKKRRKLLSVANFKFETLSKYDTGDEGRLKVILTLKNHTNRDIQSWDGMLYVDLKKKAGKVMRIPISSSKTTIPAGGTAEVAFYWRESEDTYDKFLEYPESLLKLRLLRVSVLK